MKPFILILAFLIFIIPQNKAQEYNYYHYDIKDGLSGITVYSVAQDKDGFLWFGTETGLSRFDGSHFKNYTADEGLNANEIINLFVDSKNRVWIFPFKSAIYYYYQGKIHNNSNDTLIKKFNLKNEIFKACEDKEGNIFFLEAGRVLILSSNDKLIEVNKINGKDFYGDGCGINARGNCILFLSFVEDMFSERLSSYEYNDSKFIFKGFREDKNLDRNASEINSNYTVIRNANFFEITNYRTNEQFKIKIPDHFHTVSYISDSCFAISTAEKTFLLDIYQKKIVDSFLTYKTMNRCFRDNENNLWFASIGYGLYVLATTKFKTYKFEDNHNFMPVYSLSKNGQNLYIGCTKLLFWNLNLQNNALKKIKLGKDYNIGRVSSIQVLDKQNLVLGSDNGIFKVSNTKISSYFPRTSIKTLFSDNSSIIVATDRSAFVLPLSNFGSIDTIWHSRTTSACKLNDQYYIGTLNGLYLIENNSKHITIDLGIILRSLKEKVISMASSTNGDLWIALENYGLICLRKNKIAYKITSKNGLTSNQCRSLYMSKNNLWVGTNKGISKIDLSNYPFQITNYTAAEGLDCEIINCICVNGDSVFAGTPFGISFFKDNKIEQKSLCSLKLLDIKSKNNDWYFKQDSIRLSSNDNFLRFEYTGISFVSAGDITYYYQLKGLDTSWRSTSQNIIEFQSLPAGSYQFNIYAVNRYNIKSKTITVSFIKAQTFWQLLWIRILILSLIILSIWYIMRQTIRRVRAKSNENLMRERKIYELEQMALRAQMNPHFIFNSLNSIQQYVFAGNAIEANQFITNFSSLMRQTLYISGKKFIALDEEIKYLDTYLNLEQAKYENIFDFQINQAKEIIDGDIIVPPLLLQPYIENSIRHGVLNMKEYRGKIFIDFIVENNFLRCIIEDNGIGRENAIKLKKNSTAKHQSKGMELVQKRIESLNSIYNILITVFIEDLFENNKTGTRVTIKLPLNYE